MMRFFYLIALTIIAFAVNAAGWAFAGPYYNSNNPGKCTFDNATILSPGEKIQHPDKETCAIMECLNKEGYLYVVGCVLQPYVPNCKSGGPIDKYAPYPKCCEEHLICNEIDENTTESQDEIL